MRLPDYHRSVTTQVQSGYGSVQQRALHDPGERISLAELNGLSSSRERDAIDEQIRKIQGRKWEAVGGTIMQVASIAAAGIGAAQLSAASGSAVASGATGPMAGIEGTLALENIKNGVVTTDAALVPEALAAGSAKGAVGEAMLRTAFPEISNAYDYGAKLAGGKIGSNDNTQAVNRQLADRQIIDAEIAKMMQTSQPEDYDKNMNEIFNEVMGEAKFGASKLSKGAYEAYYASMQDYENTSRKSVVQQTAKQMYDDKKNMTNALIDLEISKLNENDPEHNMDATQARINKLLTDGMTGNPNEENPISVYTPDQVAVKQMEIDSSLRVSQARNELLSKHGYQGAVNALLNQNSYTYLTPDERSGLIDELSSLATQREKSVDATSVAAMKEIENMEWDIRDGNVNLDEEIKKRDAYMTLGHKRELRAYFSAYVDSPSGDTKKANAELAAAQVDFSNGDIDSDEFKATADRITLENPGAVSIETIRTIHNDAEMKRLVPTIKMFAEKLNTLKDKDGKSFLDGVQIQEANSAFMELTNTDAFRAMTEDQKRIAVASITDSILISKAVSGPIDLDLGKRIGGEVFEEERIGSRNINNDLEVFVKDTNRGAHMASWDRRLEDITKVGQKGEAYVASQLGKAPTRYLENGGWVYAIPEYNKETGAITQKEYYIDIVPSAKYASGEEPKLVAIDSQENTSAIHKLEGRMQNGYVAPVVYNGKVISEGAIIINGQRKTFDIATAERVKSPYAEVGEVSNIFAFPDVTPDGRRKTVYFEIDETNQRTYPIPDPTPYLAEWGYPGTMDDYFAAYKQRGIK